MNTILNSEIPKQSCSFCGYVADTAANPFSGVKRPKPGDLIVCMNCGHLTAFGPDMKQRPLTPEEEHYIAGDPRLLALQEVRGEVMKKQKEKENGTRNGRE